MYYEGNSVNRISIGRDMGWGRADLSVKGALFAGNSDLYFDNRNHNHSGIGNTAGYAAIENAKNYDALMILGRAGTDKGRKVKLWDYLQVNGTLETTGNAWIAGKLTPSAGNTEANGILFPKNPGGGGSDAAWLRYYPRSGESCALEICTSNPCPRLAQRWGGP